MKRVIPVAAMAVLLLTFAGPASAAPIARESFEAGFGPWVPDTDGRAPTSSVTLSTEQAYDGIRSVRIFMDGRKDDGTTWVEAQFVVAGWRPYQAGWTFRTDATGRFRVALGTSVIWEVQKAHHIDAVRVDLVTV